MNAAGLSVTALAADSHVSDGPSIALKWLEMSLPADTPVGTSTLDSSVVNDRGGNLSSSINRYGVQVVKTGNEFIKAILNPLNMVSVIGPARSGKSTLMNLLAGCTVGELFPTSPGAITFTKGIYIPSRVLKLAEFSALENEPVVEALNSDARVTFIDTEGQGAVGTLYDMNLFSPALISSKIVIYNRTGGLLTDEILQQLGMMTQAAQRLTSSDKKSDQTADEKKDVNDKPQVAKPCFGHLVIIFNQFRINPKDDVNTLTTQLLDQEKEIDSASKTRNDVRSLLTSVFESVKVFILPDGQLKDGVSDALSDGTKPFLLLSDFKPKYLDYFKKLRQDLSQKLVTPRELSADIPLTGGSIADFVPKFASAINTSKTFNIPSIFQAAQNDAINSATLDYSKKVGEFAASHTMDEAKATAVFTRIIDTGLQTILDQVKSTISYMPPQILQNFQENASASVVKIKTQMLSTNLAKAQSVMQQELSVLLAGLSKRVDSEFTAEKLLISEDIFTTKFDAYKSGIIKGYEQKGNDYDSNSLPKDYIKTLDSTIELARKIVLGHVVSAWGTWLNQTLKPTLDTLTDGLVNLNKKTPVGEAFQYDSEQTTLAGTAKQTIKGQLNSSYKWKDGQDKFINVSKDIDTLCITRKALWQNNSDAVQKELKKKLESQKMRYKNHIQDLLQPMVEPPIYNTTFDAEPYRNVLVNFMSTNSISDSISDDILLDFDSFVSDTKSNFIPKWDQAYNRWLAYMHSRPIKPLGTPSIPTKDWKLPSMLRGGFFGLDKR